MQRAHCFSPCLRGRFAVFNFGNYPILAISAICLLSSTTSILSGQSAQLCRQHTITSHPSGSCLCSLKLRLSNSNSILTRSHFPGTISRLASQSGNAVCIRSTRKPSSAATAPNKKITPARSSAHEWVQRIR
jgi:hypothetical protein